MPFGQFKNFEHCVRVVSHRKNPPSDPQAYCAWIRRKIEGGDREIIELLAAGNIDATIKFYHQWLIDNPLEGMKKSDLEVKKLLTRGDAKRILDKPEVLREWEDSQLIDDHRWIHMWEHTLEQGKNLFIDKKELRKLHDMFVDEMARRGFDSGLDHKTPIKVAAIELIASPVSALLDARKPVLLDDEFISFIGSAMVKQDPRDIDLMLKCPKNMDWQKAVKQAIPAELTENLDFVFESSGPSGPYLPAYELWAIPKKTLTPKEPRFEISPLSPTLPATPTRFLNNPRDLIEDSYYIEPYDGLRAMIHRKDGVVMAFDKDLEEIEVPDKIKTELLGIEDPTTFILDGFLVSENNETIYRFFDMPWWRESQHIYQMAETRRHFLGKLPKMAHVKYSRGRYFASREDAINFLVGESGPYLVIPCLAPYPNNGQAQWLLYEPREAYDLAESTDTQIKRLVDEGKWESMSADARFRLMTKRQKIEPLYPFAQMKTTKKGYSQREVFGLKSVKDLAEDLFKVPTKQASEVKIDGFRAQVHKSGDEVRIFTESGHEITKNIPGVAENAKKVPAKSFVLDAEATPYGKDLENLGRAAAAPAFAKGATRTVDDSRWALHVFDMLYVDGEDIHGLPYEDRRKRLRGIELPIRDAPKNMDSFRMQLWENNVYWATSAEQMIKHAETVSAIPGSEGAMFKDAGSKYRLSGNTPLWSKMKSTFEIDALVVGVNRDEKTFNYVAVIGPVSGVKADSTAPLDSPRGRKFVQYKGSIYSIIGKSFNTKIAAEIGDIIRVTVKSINKIGDKVYHWFHPQVLEKREDKTKPDPLETAQTIYETEKKKQRASAFLIGARAAEDSPIACCLSPWVAYQSEDGAWQYIQNNEETFSKLQEFNITQLIGTSLTRGLADKLDSLRFQLTSAETIGEWEHEIIEYSEDPILRTEIQPKQLTEQLMAFTESIKDMPDECMKLSCGGVVPLKPLKLAENLYLTYPDENKEWPYVIQFHVRGLSVHADFRCQISKSQLVGWTWDLGKSLIKPMLRRTSASLREKAGITAEDLKKPIREISSKLKSTAEGRKLGKALSNKVDDLDMKIVRQMLDELWRDEAEPILADPNKKILTQIKHPMPTAWLEYEEEIPAGAVGSTSELGGFMVIMDKGRCQYGAQKSYFHEYWISGERIKNRRMIVRRLATRPEWGTKQSFAWLTFFSKPAETPYTISTRAVQQDWMPAQSVSAIPQTVRAQIPSNRRYWKARNAKEIRNQLVKDIKKKEVTLKLSPGLQFSVKRVWHKGPEVRRGLPVTRYWLLLHSGGKVVDAWDFGQNNDPLEGGAILVRRRDAKGLKELLKTTGELAPDHPASQTKKLKNHFDTSDSGSAKFVQDSDTVYRMKLDGDHLKGTYVFVKESGDMWTFGPASLTEQKKTTLLQAASCITQCPTTKVLHLAASDLEVNQVGDLLFLRGPAIKPGEVLPMDGRPSYFTREGIKKFWPSMYRQPIVVLHGDLKGDVIGFVNKAWFEKETGWGWVEGIVWHPAGIKLILEKKLPAFSIEVIPETIWDSEHKHEHVIGGECIGLAVVPKGACVTCTPIDFSMGKINVEKGKIYKYGLTPEAIIAFEYWEVGKSTQEIADALNKPRSTIENWMNSANIPRRGLLEARHLRAFKEELVRKYGGRAFITALGTGAFTDIPRDDCPQCKEARAGGKSRRNYTSTLVTLGNDHLLINAPKGIANMLGSKKVKPKYVILEHIHEDVVGGLHELRALKPTVFATSEAWDYIRRHYRALSGKKDGFEKLYDFERRILPTEKSIKIGSFVIEGVPISHASKGQPTALGYKINAGGTMIFHVSDVFSIPGSALKNIDVYIGDGASLNRDIGDQHASIKKQIAWAKEAEIPKILFTQIGHVGKTHKDLNEALKEITPNAQALYDGAEIQLSPGNPGAHFTTDQAAKIAEGKIIVRAKPYQEYAKQAIYFLGDTRALGIYVEGYPEGPLSAEKVRTEMGEEHGLSEGEWKQQLGDAEQVWIYRPRILKKFEEPKECRQPEYTIGPYIPNVKVMEEIG